MLKKYEKKILGKKKKFLESVYVFRGKVVECYYITKQ